MPAGKFLSWHRLDRPSRRILDLAARGPILHENKTQGSHRLRGLCRASGADDPLNLMRVMPPQGAAPAMGAFQSSAVPHLRRTASSFRMIASKDTIAPHSSDQLPASTRVYVTGELFPDVRVPMREIA